MKVKSRYKNQIGDQSGCSRLVRFGMVTMMVFMLAMAVMPVSPTGVSAKERRQVETNLNLTIPVEQAEIAPEINVDVDDLVAVTVEPTLSDPIAYAAVQINKLGCGDDFSGNYNDLAANCSPMDAVFALSHAGGEVGYNGSFTNEQVVPGDVAIYESVPEGYGNPIVFCNAYYASGAESGFGEMWIEDGALYTNVESGEWLYCDWFNIEMGLTIKGGDNSIYINKHLCPVDYDIDTATYNDFAADCNESHNGVNFSLSLEDAVLETQATGSEIDSAVNFDGLLPATYEVTEELPVGFKKPAIFCSAYVPGDEAPADSFQVNLEDGDTSVDLNLDDYVYIFCDWYNVPTNDGSIVIHKWNCPENLAFIEEPTVDDFLAACDQSFDGVTFDLSYPDDAEAVGLTRTTGDDGAGTAIFNGVQPGNIAITEQIPSGYGDPIVYCGWGAIYDEDGEGGNPAIAIDGMIPLASVPGGVLYHEMYPNETMSCEWFNIPSDDTDVVIHKWECPEDWNAYDWSYDDLIIHCDQAMEGIDFTLTATDAGEDAEGPRVENTDADGHATFDGVQAGPYTLTEAMPTGFGEPIVYCYVIEGEPNQYDVNQGTVELEIGEHRIVCDWFNVPTDDGSITIFKYTCPADYDIYGPAADPKNDCVLKTNGIDFNFSGPSFGEIVKTTGEDFDGGWTVWSLGADTYTVTEYVPEGTIGTFVTCQWLDEEGPYLWNSIQPYNPNGAGLGYQIDLDLPKHTNIVCQWYNVPENYEGGELVIIKYWCDGNIYDEAHCELYGGGANFAVDKTLADFDTIYVTTGWDGTASLYLAPGSYDLWETDREWCKAESDQVNEYGEVEIYDGETSYVTVYNCGPGKEKEPPVKKFPNTGVGPDEMNGAVANNGTAAVIMGGGSMLMIAIAGAAIRVKVGQCRIAA